MSIKKTIQVDEKFLGNLKKSKKSKKPKKPKNSTLSKKKLRNILISNISQYNKNKNDTNNNRIKNNTNNNNGVNNNFEDTMDFLEKIIKNKSINSKNVKNSKNVNNVNNSKNVNNVNNSKNVNNVKNSDIKPDDIIVNIELPDTLNNTINDNIELPDTLNNTINDNIELPYTLNNTISDKKTSNYKIDHNNKNIVLPIIDNSQFQITKPQYTSNIVNNNVNIKKEPPYSNLKNGKKPTYREWKKTLKKQNFKKIFSHDIKTKLNIDNNDNIGFNKLSDKKKNLLNFKNEYNHKLYDNKLYDNNNIVNTDNIVNKKKFKKTIKKTIKYKLGKNINNNIISVFIKNNISRKKIISEINNLNNDKLNDIKIYLKKKNLIKINNCTPDYIIKEIYVNAVLCGDIINTNKNNLLHNYINQPL